MNDLYLLQGTDGWAGCTYVGHTQDPPLERSYPLLAWGANLPGFPTTGRHLIHSLLNEYHQAGWWYCMGDLPLVTIAYLFVWFDFWGLAQELEAYRLAAEPQQLARGAPNSALTMLSRAAYFRSSGWLNVWVGWDGELEGVHPHTKTITTLPRIGLVSVANEEGAHRMDTWAGLLVDRAKVAYPSLWAAQSSG